MSLKVKAIQGAKWTVISAIVSAAVQLIQIAVLAHFLEKKDFGIMAMAVFVIGISQIFMDMGISNAVIHKQQVSERQLNTLYWLNIFLGGAIYLILLLLSGTVARFYNEPQLAGVLNWVGLTFIIQPFGQQYDVLLRKELAFKPLAIRDIISKMAGLLISIVLAYLQYGVYALVFANLVTALVATVLLVLVGYKYHRPQLEFSFNELWAQGYLSFGIYQVGEKMVNYFNANLDTLLIGKLLGMDALGLYNVAKTIAFRPYLVINPVVTKVFFPVLARLQTELMRMKEVYLKMVGFLTSTNAPVYAMMIILAKPLVMLLFGEKWLDTASILQILSVSGLSISIVNPVGALQLARGRADMGFYWNLAMLLFIPLSIWIGHSWGIIGVALVLTALRLILLLPSWSFFIKPLSGAGFISYFKSWGRPVCWSAISGLAAVPVINISNSYYSIVLGIAIIGTVYLGLNFLFEKERIKEMKDFLSIIRNKSIVQNELS